MSQSSTSASQALLLLPPIPQPANYPAIKAAFHTPVLLALRSLKEHILGRSILDIALPCPHLYNSHSASRASLYNQTQKAVANVYKLVCVIAAKLDIEVADVDGDAIDVRVILVAYPRNGVLKASEQSPESWFGPVIGLRDLAKSARSWSQVFSVETEQGEQLLKNFQSLSSKSGYTYQKFRGGVVSVDNSSTPPTSGDAKRCDWVAVGGTFDHLHIGHKLLLTMVAFALDLPNAGEKQKDITIGMTAADLLAKKKYAELLQSWRTRTERTHAFMRGILSFTPDSENLEKIEELNNPGPNGHIILIRTSSPLADLVIRYTEIWDPFGPTITDPDIDTLVVSGETRSGGKMVNDKRGELGMKELAVLEVDVLDTEEDNDHGSDQLENAFQAKLSSSEIRKIQAEKLKNRSKVTL